MVIPSAEAVRLTHRWNGLWEPSPRTPRTKNVAAELKIMATRFVPKSVAAMVASMMAPIESAIPVVAIGGTNAAAMATQAMQQSWPCKCVRRGYT